MVSRRRGLRLVTHTDDLIAYCPFASRLPLTIRLTTLAHQSCFEDLNDATVESVAHLTTRLISWLERLHPRVSYNLLLHTQPPVAASENESYHWSLELFPRISRVAGFEWSSQCMINPVLPETAAADLRQFARADDPRGL